MLESSKYLTPAQIVAELDKYIIGQNEAKRNVSIALRNRWRRMNASPEMQKEIVPNNILMIVWFEFVQPAGNSCKKIGIQRIDENGRKMEKLFITPDTLTATYPVIEGLPDNSSIVAYTLKKQGKNYIAYQLVH